MFNGRVADSMQRNPSALAEPPIPILQHSLLFLLAFVQHPHTTTPPRARTQSRFVLNRPNLRTSKRKHTLEATLGASSPLSTTSFCLSSRRTLLHLPPQSSERDVLGPRRSGGMEWGGRRTGGGLGSGGEFHIPVKLKAA